MNLFSDSSLNIQKQTPKSDPAVITIPPSSSLISAERKPICLQFKNWDEFQIFASTRMLAFNYRESDKTMEVSTVVNEKICVYVGPAPDFGSLLKFWLGGQLQVSTDRIVEGSLES
jgi:hypothetical protein